MKWLIKRRKVMIMTGIIILVFILFLVWQDNSIVISKLDYKSEKLPDAFNEFKITHISDLHNKFFGGGQKYILKKLNSTKPDLIVITGDLIDRRRYDLDSARIFIQGAVKIAPVYYVTGNHEAWSSRFNEIREMLESAGVIILDDSKAQVKKTNGYINLIGLSDPAFNISEGEAQYDGQYIINLRGHIQQNLDNQTVNILLSHRPELFNTYKMDGLDLIFSGHAHGGQIRLPFVGGILAPGQGFFPKYTSGMHTEDGVSMVVSRGLGNSVFPFRIFNRPEIVVVTLMRE